MKVHQSILIISDRRRGSGNIQDVRFMPAKVKGFGLRISIFNSRKDPFRISIISQENHQKLILWLRTAMRFGWKAAR